MKEKDDIVRRRLAAALAALCLCLAAPQLSVALNEKNAVSGCVVHEGSWIRTNEHRQAALYENITYPLQLCLETLRALQQWLRRPLNAL